MTAAVSARPRAALREPALTAARLLLLELRRNAMPWILPVAVALFWLTSYRKAMAMPPLWYARTAALHVGALLAFACPVAGAAAWMGSRDRRRRTADLVTTTARPRWASLLAVWAATSCWALAGYLGCAAVLYGATAQQATWGGPLWWPVAVGAAALPAFAAVGLAAGTLAPSRFTAPVAAIATFFVIALSTQLITGSQSYWNVSPVVAAPWDLGPDLGVATFYPYLPDLSIAQVMFLAGLTMSVLGALALPTGHRRWLLRPAAACALAGLAVAGTGVALAGTGRLDRHGMIAIPALHDAASNRPLRYTPVCGHTAIPVCLNPAYASFLPAVAGALAPVLNEVAGLPGAPARISQAAVAYRQGPGNAIAVGLAGPQVSGTPPVFHLVLLSGQTAGRTLTDGVVASDVRSAAGPGIVASVIGTASPAQQVVVAAVMQVGRVPRLVQAGPRTPLPAGVPPSAVTPVPRSLRPAVQRFAALPASVRHAWLMRHLAALRAGRLPVAQLP